MSAPIRERQMRQLVLFRFCLARQYKHVSKYRVLRLVGSHTVLLEPHQHFDATEPETLPSLMRRSSPDTHH